MSTAATSSRALQKSPIVLPSLGVLYVLCVPLLAATTTMRGDALSVAGFNYTGFVWLAAMFVGAALVFVKKSLVPRRVIYFPVLVWTPWVCILWASVAWTDGIDKAQIRDALMHTMPIVVGIATSVFIRTRRELTQLVRTFYWSVPLLWCSVFAWAALGLKDGVNDTYVEVRGLSLTAAFIAGIAIAGTQRDKRSWLIWAACLAIAFVTGSRMATLAILMLPLINPLFRSFAHRIVAIVFIALVGIGLLNTAAFQERFFHGQGGLSDIASGNFDSAGRFDVWPIVLDEALKQPLLGHGIGTVQRLIPEIWFEVVHPHNDYLRLGYEVGAVGLAVFLLAFSAQFVLLLVWAKRTTGVVRQAFAGAWLGMAVFLLAACTDNPITYSTLFMNPIFALMGAAYAVACTERREAPAGEI